MSFMPHGSDPAHAQFTCNTCGIKFVTAELQRKHMKTDWHRYNLKRRVVGLPSITSDIFAEKVLLLVNQVDEQQDEFGFYVNKRDRKKRSMQQANDEQNVAPSVLEYSHVKQEKVVAERRNSATSLTSEFSEFSLGESCDYHSEIETGSELNYTESETSEFELVTSDDDSIGDALCEENPENHLEQDEAVIPITTCFFCGKNNQEIETNIRHMFSSHGLYLPERSFLHDVSGLMTYLSSIISNYECLVCQFQGKNLTSIRQHSIGKGHCKLPYETKEDKLLISHFYTFYDDEPQAAHTDKKVAFNDVEEASTEDDEDEAYGLSEDDDDNGINDNYAVVQLDRSGNAMTLPTGSIIGHRSQMKYYRQSLPVAREAKESETTVALVDRRFAPGLTVHTISKQEKQTRKLELKANNVAVRRDKSRKVNYQPHFRDEILGT